MIIHFFGSLGDRIAREIRLDLPADVRTVAQLRQQLAARYPGCAADLLSPSVRVCVGDSIVAEDHALDDRTMAEFFPPLSGG